MLSNPFSPAFGISPSVLVGREDILAELGIALAVGPRHPAFTSFLLGVRGVGKTVLLNAMEEKARSLGWLTISESASTPSVPSRITQAAGRLLAGQDRGRGPRVSSRSAFGVGIGIERDDADLGYQPSLRDSITELADALEPKGAGLLITVDELHAIRRAELMELGATIQHVARREERLVALLMAGLPSVEETLLADEAVTLLHRCPRFDLGRLRSSEVSHGLVEPLKRTGVAIDQQALDSAVTAIGGYPFMLQLVGFHTWEAARERQIQQSAAEDPVGVLGSDEVARGVTAAGEQMIRMVLKPLWSDLSDVDRKLALAMAKDDGASRVADLAARLGVTSGYVGVYRNRLIKSGMAISPARGRLNFTHPATRAWLRSSPELL